VDASLVGFRPRAFAIIDLHPCCLRISIIRVFSDRLIPVASGGTHLGCHVLEVHKRNLVRDTQGNDRRLSRGRSHLGCLYCIVRRYVHDLSLQPLGVSLTQEAGVDIHRKASYLVGGVYHLRYGNPLQGAGRSGRVGVCQRTCHVMASWVVDDNHEEAAHCCSKSLVNRTEVDHAYSGGNHLCCVLVATDLFVQVHHAVFRRLFKLCQAGHCCSPFLDAVLCLYQHHEAVLVAILFPAFLQLPHLDLVYLYHVLHL